MTQSSTIAVAQFAPGADRDANLSTMAELANTAARRGASMVVFPEYSSYFSPMMGPDWVAAAESIDGAFANGLAELARSRGIHVVAGMIERTSSPGRASNTVLAFSPEGSLLAKYRKIHLFDAFGELESDWIVPGPIEPPELFTWGGFVAGIQTCYDIRFPEMTRRLVDAGADLIVLPSEWVAGPNKVNQWRNLITARAIENVVYVAAADQSPPYAAGDSMVVDPMGIEIATVRSEAGIAVAEISPDRVTESRITNPALQLRRL
jgi:deaminated glutathione amidase